MPYCYWLLSNKFYKTYSIIQFFKKRWINHFCDFLSVLKLDVYLPRNARIDAVEQQHANYLTFSIARSSLRNQNIMLRIFSDKIDKLDLTKLWFSKILIYK